MSDVVNHLKVDCHYMAMQDVYKIPEINSKPENRGCQYKVGQIAFRRQTQFSIKRVDRFHHFLKCKRLAALHGYIRPFHSFLHQQLTLLCGDRFSFLSRSICFCLLAAFALTFPRVHLNPDAHAQRFDGIRHCPSNNRTVN